MAVDLRKLNEGTFGDVHPLPDITEILDQLGQSIYYTCWDMAMGYQQIELEQERDQRPRSVPSSVTGSTADFSLG
jgi:hypothetical protein